MGDADNFAVVSVFAHFGGDKTQAFQELDLLFTRVCVFTHYRFVKRVKTVVYERFDLGVKHAQPLVFEQTHSGCSGHAGRSGHAGHAACTACAFR